jgi:hypothetical protein
MTTRETGKPDLRRYRLISPATPGFRRWKRHHGAGSSEDRMAKKQELKNSTTIGDVPTDGASTDSQSSLSGKLATLRELNEHHLRIEWRRLHRRQPPRLSRDLLTRGVAYRIQEMAAGGLSKATRRKLAAFARQLETAGRLIRAADTPQLRSGARLVREWRGRTHTVTVIDGGFDYAGKTYPSLSRIAEMITGAHWSGPRFFGIGTGKPAPSPSDDDSGGASLDSGEQAHV